MDGTHLVDPLAIRQPPRLLHGDDGRPAPLADLAGDVQLVVLRIEVVELPLVLLVLVQLPLPLEQFPFLFDVLRRRGGQASPTAPGRSRARNRVYSSRLLG
jgi:hypothetical protein